MMNFDFENPDSCSNRQLFKILEPVLYFGQDVFDSVWVVLVVIIAKMRLAMVKPFPVF